MPCSTLIDPTCLVGKAVSATLGSAASGVLSGIAAAIRDGLTWMVTNSATLWLRIPSPDLVNEPAVTAIQEWMLPVTTAVAIGGMIAAGARMALTRRANPLLDVSGGLVTIAAAGSLGVIVPNLLMQAGDSWANWVLQVSTHGAFTSRLNTILDFPGAPDSIVIILGVAALLMTAVQAVLMVFRQAAIVILAAVLPLAAAGSIAPMTRSWIRKLVTWMLALICYKPAVAAVYATAFTMIGSGANWQTMLMGFAMIGLSLVALPVLMRFFTWTTGSVGTGGGGGQFFGMAAGAVAAGALRGGSGGAGTSAASSTSPGPAHRVR